MIPAPAIKALSLLLSLLVAALGAVVIAGWYLHIPLLLQIHPSFVPMQYNTALGFLLSGLGVLSLQLSRPRQARLLAVGVLLIGGLTLWQMLTGLDLHIDQLFMQHYVTVKTSTPGRMAPNTAVCFILVGINLWLLASSTAARHKTCLSCVLAPAILALALIALGGYLIGAETAYGWGNLTRMAVHTSVGFVALGLILRLQQPVGWQISCLPGIGMALLVLVLTLWQALETQESAALRNKARLRIEQLKANWSAENTLKKQALKQLAEHPDDLNGPLRSDIRREAREDIENRGFLFVAHYTNDGKHEFVEGDVALAKQLADNTGRELCLTQAAAMRTLFQMEPFADPVLTLMMPFGDDGRAVGCIMVATSLRQLLDKLRAQTAAEPYPLTITTDDRILHREASDGPWSVETTLQEQGIDLHLRLTPTQEQLASSLLPVVILVAGIALDALLIYALFWMGVARRRESEALDLQKQMQQELSLRMKVIENAPYGILLTDRDGKIKLVNHALEQLFGYTGAELVGQPVECLVPGEQRAAHAKNRHNYQNKNAQPGPMAANRLILGRLRNGNAIPVEVTLSPITQDGQTNVIAIVVDVRERIEAQRRIEAQMNELARINEEVNNFAYVASHDLKAPLRGIDQLAGWITEDLGDSLPGETKDHLRLMQQRIGRMERLLNDLLAYSRAGRSKDEIVTVNTRDLVNEIFELAAPEKQIHLQVAADLPVLHTQKVPLELVFRNLIGNAIKHHDKLQGIIEISARPTANGYEFAVRDDGPGIPPEHHQRMFAMFQTLKPRDEVEGSGIGLALVKKAVESMGGVVTVESDGTQGAIFRFTWPASSDAGAGN